jgi:hypothetical protein
VLCRCRQRIIFFLPVDLQCRRGLLKQDRNHIPLSAASNDCTGTAVSSLQTLFISLPGTIKWIGVLKWVQVQAIRWRDQWQWLLILLRVPLIYNRILGIVQFRLRRLHLRVVLRCALRRENPTLFRRTRSEYYDDKSIYQRKFLQTQQRSARPTLVTIKIRIRN